MGALNTPIDLCCIFEGILMDWACSRERASERKDRGEKELTLGALAS